MLAQPGRSSRCAAASRRTVAAFWARTIPNHTVAEDAGRIAQRAGVKTLVLSHLVPPDDPEISDQMWLDAAVGQFRGTVLLGKDLLEV